MGVAMFLVGLFVGLAVWLRAKHRSDSQVAEMHHQISTLTSEKQADAEKLEWLGSAQEKMKDTFQALAGEALKSNSQALTAETKKDVVGVVDPLRERLKSLDEHVRALERARAGAYEGIEKELANLRETHGRLQESTISLSQALRSQSVRGKWGEIQLRRVVEMAGMENHVAFDEQTSTEGGRPDLIAYLPNGGVLPVDAKVPLTAYLRAMEAGDDEGRKQEIILHAKAVRSRVNELGQKKYWDQFESSPDFVVMFVPNEACLGAAFEMDPDLLEYAIDKRVLISSPVTLVALLRSVAYGWQQHHLTQNAKKIAGLGKELFDRAQVFLGHLATLGKSLNKSNDAYNKTLASFDRRLMPSVRKLQDLAGFDTELEVPPQIDTVPAIPASLVREDQQEE